MRIKGISVIVPLVVLATLTSVAQDKIYLASSTKQGKITAISAATVTYRSSQEKSPLINIPLSNVVLLINEKGSWLAPAQLNFEEEKTKQSITSFLSQEQPAYTEDRIYCIDMLRMDGKILDEDDKSITAVVNNVTKQIPKSAVVAILYRSGRHVIFGTSTEALDALVKAKPAPAIPALNSTASNNKEMHPLQTGTAAAETSTPEPVTFESLAGNVSKAEFEEKVMQKTNQFSAYLKILCNKSIPFNERDKAKDMAINLFVDSNVIVETSSVTSTSTTPYKIYKYLSRILMLPYDKIELEWTNVQYVTDVRLAEDGTWRGSVTFEQTFTGYRDGQPIYKDLTTKKAEVVMKIYNKNVEGQRTTNWDVLLANIGVRYTKAL